MTDQNRPIVRLQDVSKFYTLGLVRVQALKKVNLDIMSGEFTAIIGASGSGKSTLLNLIGCIDEQDEGRIWIDSIELSTLSDNQKSDLRNLKIGFIFQSFNLVPVLNVFENIELPLLINPTLTPAERKSRVEESIADVGLEAVSKNRPEQLSGGQRQRVAIARALAGRPLLVLADEPTANLDSVTSNKIIDLMIDLNQKKKVTFVFSTHDEKVMNRVNRIVHIRDGVIVP